MTPDDKREDERTPESAHASNLTAALLRIGASLDLQTVLREVIESARALTGARYGCLTTMDETGQPQDVVTSGFTEEEHRAIAQWPDGPKLFELFRDLPGPVRIPDVPTYLISLGFSADRLPSAPFQGTPMRHRGVHLGNFYLVEKENGAAFTDEDEEILVLFAAHAAAVITHAHAYRDERHARADLETLLDTSPVGVVVFDPVTGQPVSLNREAKRLVEFLRLSGCTTEDLLQTLTCRRADGRETTLDQFPLVQELRNAELVRAEEMVLSVPDGRSVRVLVNATPIHAEDGVVASVVVTIQDLSSIDELEKMRAEFIGMVSHELRAPLTAIKGSTATLLETALELDPAERREFYRIIADQTEHMRKLISDLLDVGRIDTGTLSVSPEPSELADLMEQARATFLSGGDRHAVLVHLPPDLPRVLTDRQRIVQVLNNLLANAARYAAESSSIEISAVPDGVYVAVSVSDKGRGVAPEQLPFLLRKYAPPGERGITRGLGLAICKGLVEAHGGRIRVESAGIGLGTRVTFTLPTVEDSVRPNGASPQRLPPEDRPAARILVVDDDPETLRYVRNVLTEAGYTTLVTGDHTALAQIISMEQPNLVLLDLVLPGADGIKLMEQIPTLADRPVIFISGYGHDETIARAFAAGADDYIVKPFSPMELTARVKAALHRCIEPNPYTLGDLSINYERRQVLVARNPVELTALEYELLREFSLSDGRVVTYDTLLRRVWHGRAYGDPKTLVRAFVKQLRQKLGDNPGKPSYIVTVRGVGYRMARPDDT